MKAENFDYSALPQDAFELTHNDIHKHVDRNFASQNYWKDALVRVLRNKGAIFGLIMIAIIIFFAVFGPGMTPYTYESQIITVLGPLIVNTMTGSLVIEKIFSIPGIGELMVRSIQQNDYNVTIALSFIYSLMYIGIMLVVDILYGIIDPRIRLSKEDNHES